MEMKTSRFFSATLATATAIVMFSSGVVAAPVQGVNWGEQVITVVGTGFPPEGVTIPSQAKKLAERAAMNEAYRQLAEIVKGVNVTGETTVQSMMLLSDKITTKVNAVVKGAKKISARETGDGGVEVMVQMPMFGASNSLAGIVMEKPKQKVPFPNPVPNVAPTKPAYTEKTPVQQRIDIVVNGTNSTGKTTVNVQTTPMSSYTTENVFGSQTQFIVTPQVVLSPMSNINISSLPKVNSPRVETPAAPQLPATPQVQQPVQPQTSAPVTPQVQKQPEQKNLSTDTEVIGGYTGVIIDCSGLNLQPVMSPVIKNENHETIYGDKNLDYDKVIEMGMAGYSDGTANIERAGKNPIVVKAVAVENFNSNPVLSVADANRVLLENKSSNFLDNMNVVFIQ